MIAYLLAAGCAMRLRPITEKFPKCLLTVKGMPILEHCLRAIIKSKKFKCAYVNVHHCADDVENWCRNYSRVSNFPIKIIDEREKLLGTAGTLFWHGEFEEDFMVMYTDTYSKQFFSRLGDLVDRWQDNPWLPGHGPIVGLVAFELPPDSSAGAIEMDKAGMVTAFSEKSSDGDIGWAGFMFARPQFLREIRVEDKDLARDVFPRLCGRMRVVDHVDAHDIGRGIEDYERLNSKI